MLRNHSLEANCYPDSYQLFKQTAFHEAGHATSIHLGNQKKKLPPVFFQIQIMKQPEHDCQFFAKVIDGRLIHSFPIVGYSNLENLSSKDKTNLQLAYEADITNFLVGPLAEARYVAQRDGEEFNIQLLSLYALKKYYGGSYDIEYAQSYLDYFLTDEKHKEQKMQALFELAFNFVNNPYNWKQISKLAQFILNANNDQINCEEICTVLESA